MHIVLWAIFKWCFIVKSVSIENMNERVCEHFCINISLCLLAVGSTGMRNAHVIHQRQQAKRRKNIGRTFKY